MSAVAPTQTQAALLTRQGTVTPAETGDQQIAVCCFSTGADVERYDWHTGETYIERLSMKPASVRLERLNAGASVLNAHGSYDLSQVVGHIVKGSARIEAGELRGDVFVDDAEVWPKVKSGSINALSVGYRVHEYTVTEATEQSKQIRLATDWSCYEVSLVPIPADPGALVESTRSLEGGKNHMDPTQTIIPETALVTAERAAVLTRGMPEGTAKAWVAAGISERQGRELALAAMATRAGDDGPQINAVVIQDQADTARNAVVSALLHRMSPNAWPIEGSPGAREFAGLSLRELERSWKRQGGRGWLESRGGGSHTTGDFAALTADALGKELRRRYMLTTPTWQGITQTRQASDFKQLSSVQLGDAPKLLETVEAAEIQHGTMSDAAEKYRLKRYSRVLALSYELIVNDDLGALQQVPSLFSMSARQTESDVVWAALTDNPEMSDGENLFHSSHSNTATPAAAISVASLGVATALLRSQKSLDNQHINPEPMYLIVSPAKETLARQFTRTLNPEQGSNVNPYDYLTPIVEPRLTGNVWYLATSADILPTLEVAHLMGMTSDGGPEIATAEDFDTRALKVRAEIAVGARAIDWRGITRNNGA